MVVLWQGVRRRRGLEGLESGCMTWQGVWLARSANVEE